MSNYQARKQRRKIRLIQRAILKGVVLAGLLALLAITAKPHVQLVTPVKAEPIINNLVLDFDNIEDQGEGRQEPKKVRQTSADFLVTHYCGCSICCGKWSSGSELEAYGCKGDKLTPYTSIAADPEVIPYGTICWDEDGNQYIVQDVGGGIKGYHIDLFVGNHEVAKKLGKTYKTLFWEK